MSAEKRMREMLPNYYRTSEIMQNYQRASAAELERTEEKIGTIRYELSPSQTTEEIARWERDYNLYPAADADIEERRRAILTAMRAGGTVTTETIKMLAETYFGRECSVTENYAEYNITISALNGVPETAIQKFSAVARKIISAHLGFTVKMEYNTWGDVAQYTWGQLASYTWDEVWKNKGGIK